ncbi:GNAT family N-acetyltransferase [Ammoniphilus oxalaticus]|uniref:GNAT family N-acetyltransferase n=1 Tax=Ammoniphilus oxalaticus TaxID=66863 RepID=A0A419SRM3_9BACL|nr:N-acetyltransferase [Ammoniphilus oxalaticus]RKD27071.1 GNAT family N-acetyltransferase [Ammoniphilus oxalaticus]
MKIRQATIKDLDAMVELINMYAEKGLMLPRSKLSLCENLTCFSVVEDPDHPERVAGVGGLHILWEDLAEIRSLVIGPDYAGKGLGKMLVEHLCEQARQLHIRRVMALTYEEKFFNRCGFRIVDKETLPHKVWKDCINCSKFPACDEIAVIKEVLPVAVSV